MAAPDVVRMHEMFQQRLAHLHGRLSQKLVRFGLRVSRGGTDAGIRPHRRDQRLERVSVRVHVEVAEQVDARL